MNKEQMIAALNDLKYKINLGKLDNFNIEEKNNQLNEISNNLRDIDRQIKYLEDKVVDESNYKEGSEYDLAQKEQQRLEDVILNAETLLQNNESSIASYKFMISNENRLMEQNRIKINDMNDKLLDIGREIRSLGNIDTSEKQDQERQYNEQLNNTRQKIVELNDQINVSRDAVNLATNNLNRENNLTLEFTNNYNRAKNNLATLNNTMTGLSLVNEEQLNRDKEELENLKEIEQNQKDREKVLNISYSNALDGIIANLTNDKVTVPQAGEQLQDLINNIPESYFINTEKERVDELRENSLSQGRYQDEITRLQNKLNNKEENFYLSNFRIEQMEDELARWDKKIVEYNRQLSSPEEKIRQIDNEVNGLENIIKKHDVEIAIARKENDDFNSKYYQNLKNEANEKINLLKKEKDSLNNSEFKDLQERRNRTSAIAENLRSKINNKEVLLDNNRIRLAENKLRSSVAALNALKRREVFLKESAKDMLTNTAENAITSNKEIDELVDDNKELQEEPVQYNLTDDNHELNSNIKSDPLTDSINKALRDENLGVRVNDINPKITNQTINENEAPNLDETKVQDKPLEEEVKQEDSENVENESNQEPTENEEKEETVNKDKENDEQVNEEEAEIEEAAKELEELPNSKFKAKFKNAIDKLKEKAKAIKHNKKFIAWAAIIAIATGFGISKFVSNNNQDEQDDPKKSAITQEVDEKKDNKDKKEEAEDDKNKGNDDTEKDNDKENKDTESHNNNKSVGSSQNSNNSSYSNKNSSGSNHSSKNNNSSKKDNDSNNKSQYPSTNTHDNSDQISVPETEEEKKNNEEKEDTTNEEKNNDVEVPDAVITDNDKEEDKDKENEENKNEENKNEEENDDNKITIEDDSEKEDTTNEEKNNDATIEDNNTKNEDTYDNKDKVETPVVNDNSHITIEDVPSNNNSNQSKEDVYDNSNNVSKPDTSVKQEEKPSENKIELFNGETYTNGENSHENNTGSTESITVENSSYQTQNNNNLTKEQWKKIRDEYVNYNNVNEMVEDNSMTI